MSQRLSTKLRFELSTESLGRCSMVTLQFANSRKPEASPEGEAEIAAWVNEGGAGGEVRR
jgi:hypothetical protein